MNLNERRKKKKLCLHTGLNIYWLVGQLLENRNNFVLVTIDCLRPDHLGSHGYAKTSPFLDKLAKEGAMFKQAISNGAGTSTGFPPLLTSKYSLSHPFIELVKGKRSSGTFILSHDEVTISELLKQEGFNTIAVNSNPWVSSFFNYNKGFNVFEDFLELITDTKISKLNNMLKSKNQTVLYNLLKTLFLAYSEFTGDLPYESADFLNEKLLSHISGSSKPFFLWVHYMDVHDPYHPPNLAFKENLKAVKLNIKLRKLMKVQGQRKLSDSDIHPKDLEKIISLYDREIQFTDYHIKDLLKKLEHLGVSNDNTYFMITADHGEEFMEHGRFGHGYLYDETIKVPLILTGPDIDGNKVYCEQVELLDVPPTIAELMGLEENKNFLGKSLIPEIHNGSERRENVVITETKYKEYSCRTNSWKYICHHHGTRTRKKKPELYNLATDPLETNNLAKECKNTVKNFEKIILRHILSLQKIR